MILNDINGDPYTAEEALIRMIVRMMEASYSGGYDPHICPEQYLMDQLLTLFGDDKAVRRIQSRFRSRLNAPFVYPT